MTVRRVGAAGSEPTRIYSARLSAAEREAALRGLGSVLEKATEDPLTREPDGASRVRMEVQAEPMLPFKCVQWVMMKAAHPRVKIYRVSLLGRVPTERVNLDLPRDRSCCPGDRVFIRELRLKYFRLPTSAEAVTRIRIADALVEYDDGYMEPTETEELVDGARAARHPDEGEREVVLAASGGDWESDGSAWGAVEEELRVRWHRGERAVGIVSTPPPSGGDVPYRDVLTGMLLLNRLGVELVMPAGAIPESRLAPDR
jgi:hypothetical protein